MKKRSKKQKNLSPSDWAVMAVLWGEGPMAAGEVYERLSGEQDWAYATVKTLLRRLVEKGWLTYRPVGGSFLYRAAVPRDKAVRSAVKDFSDRVLNGLLSPFVAYYAEDRGLSDEEIEELEEIIRRQRQSGE